MRNFTPKKYTLWVASSSRFDTLNVIGETALKQKIVALILFTLLPLFLEAKPPSKFYTLPKVVAVQNRPYYSKHDLTFDVGWLPSDAFNKGITLGTSYTHFFKDYLAWEVINLKYSINSETSLKQEMENVGIDISTAGFGGALDYIETYATSNLVYTPFYNKSLLFNDKIVHGNTSFVIGGGLASFKNTGARALLSAGLMLRFFTRPDRSWKFNFRNNVYYEKTLGAVYALSLSVGYSIELGEAPKKIY